MADQDIATPDAPIATPAVAQPATVAMPVTEEKKLEEHWMKQYWRPMMGWLYMLVCLCDFVVFPVLWGMLQYFLHPSQITQWDPITLKGAGFFHLAMGAVLGISAFGRTQEKKVGAN